VAVVTAWLAGPASAVTPMQSSQQVALIPSNDPRNPPGTIGGVMPISTYVDGHPSESFDNFHFHFLALNNITPTSLASYDTVALIQVHTSELTSSAKAALAQFVANGGKLIIHDSDETSLNDYSWLLPGNYSTKIGAGCNGCGTTSGTSNIKESSGLISANPSDPSYVSIPELIKYTDAVGDANLLVSDDPRWFAVASGTNANGESGAQVAYASNGGLIIYNGFDTDFIKAKATDPWTCVKQPNDVCSGNNHESVDWLAQLWYAELAKSWGSTTAQGPNGLPQTTPVSSIGTSLPPSQAGLPSNRSCIAKRKLFLRLQNLSARLSTRHRKVVQIDVYVNGVRVVREKGRHMHNVTLRKLPKNRNVVVKVVATTNRRYHYISSTRYHAC
jgi:hypothetical protein